jgi:hypothetical protein
MSTVTIVCNGGLSKTFAEMKAKDAEKQAILAEEMKVVAVAAEVKKAATIAKAAKIAATREKKLFAKIENGEACTRCFRSDRKESSGTHTDELCQKFFCEECYSFAKTNNTGSRKFTTHETSDCIHVIRKKQRQLDLEMETEVAMIRRLKREKAVLHMNARIAEQVSVDTRNSFTLKTNAKLLANLPKRTILSTATFPDDGKIFVEAVVVWQKKYTEMIAEVAKKAEEEKALLHQKETEEIATAKKLTENKIAEKKTRLSTLRAKFREAKAKIEDKKTSKTQKKNSKKEIACLETDEKSLTVEITIDERFLRETLKKMKQLMKSTA